MSDQEIINQANLLLVAGNVTTTDLIGNCAKALLNNPAQLKKLQARPALITNTIEEALRFDSPVINSGRIANKDINIGGCPVGMGESLSTSLAAANHDPDIYPDPGEFDIERKDTHHQSFGGGTALVSRFTSGKAGSAGGDHSITRPVSQLETQPERSGIPRDSNIQRYALFLGAMVRIKLHYKEGS